MKIDMTIADVGQRLNQRLACCKANPFSGPDGDLGLLTGEFVASAGVYRGWTRREYKTTPHLHLPARPNGSFESEGAKEAYMRRYWLAVWQGSPDAVVAKRAKEVEKILTERAQADREHAVRYGPPPAFRFSTVADWKPETPAQHAALEVATAYPYYGPEGEGVRYPNMVISGPTGTGKTLLASIVFDNAVCERPVYITAYELVRQFRQRDRPEVVLLAQYGRGEFEDIPWTGALLIVDDVGIDADPYAAQVICEILDQRMGEDLETVFTTNATDGELKAWLGERGYSRLRMGCKWVELDGDDRRMRPKA